MKKLTALTLAVTWMFAIAPPPTASALTVPDAPVECAPGMAMDTCEAEYTVDHGDGDSTTCLLRGSIPVTIHHEDGSVEFTGTATTARVADGGGRLRRRNSQHA